MIEFSDNGSTWLAVPQNVPPTAPVIDILPATAGDNQELTCTVTTPSYDLDPVNYAYRWYRDGDFAKDLGNQAILPPEFTSVGEAWSCRVYGTDGIERSPTVVTGVTIGPEVNLEETP